MIFEYFYPLQIGITSADCVWHVCIPVPCSGVTLGVEVCQTQWQYTISVRGSVLLIVFVYVKCYKGKY